MADTKLWLVPRESLQKPKVETWHGPVLTPMCECHLVVIPELHPGLPTPTNAPSCLWLPTPISLLHYGSFQHSQPSCPITVAFLPLYKQQHQKKKKKFQNKTIFKKTISKVGLGLPEANHVVTGVPTPRRRGSHVRKLEEAVSTIRNFCGHT